MRFSAVSALSGATLFLPVIASAQTLLNTLALFSQFLNSLMYLLIILAIVVFFWGLIRYVLNAGNAEAQKEQLHMMLYGIITLFVMVSVWGIIRLLQSTFRVTSTDPIVPKSIQLDTRIIQ